MSTIDVAGDRYRRLVWLGDAAGVRPFTRGDGDRTPAWSPDGGRLAFLRDVDGCSQLAVIPVDGGEARVCSRLALGIGSEPVWSPDGRAVVAVVPEWAEGPADLDDEERARRPRRIRRRDYRIDDIGWTHDRVRRLFVLDPDGVDEPRRITDGDRDALSPAWAPDGGRIAYLSDTSSSPGYRLGAAVHEIDLGDGSVEEVVPAGAWSALAYRPDGVLHLLGSPVADAPDHAGLWRLEDGEIRPLTAHLDRALFAFVSGRPRLVFDGDRAVVSLVDRGSIGLVSVDPDGDIEPILDGRQVVTGFDAAAGTVAATVSTLDTPGRISLRRNGGEEAVHADLGGATPEIVQPDHFVVDGPGAALDVWVYLPDGDDPVPLLLNIHGGPSSQYGWGFFDEFQVYARAGFGVVATNPRGSTGAGVEFLRAVRGDGWGRVDVEDVDAVVAAALDRHRRLDAERMGVMGGSYGGFLTAWLIAHQDRWKAAIVERALLDWESFGGTSDIGGWFSRFYGIAPGDEPTTSPLSLAHRVTTPTLIVHSENDYRCPIEQAERYFDALLRAGVDAELVRFPDEGHELSRSGSPRHRQDRFDIIVEWLTERLY